MSASEIPEGEDVIALRDFGLEIRCARKGNGRSQLELGERIDVPTATLEDWEHGRSLPKPLTAIWVVPLLAQELGLDADLLWAELRRGTKQYEWLFQSDAPVSPFFSREEVYQHFANDYRRISQIRDGKRNERLAQLWGLGPYSGVSERIHKLFQDGYLAPEERAPQTFSVCPNNHPLAPENIGANHNRCLICLRAYSIRKRRAKGIPPRKYGVTPRKRKLKGRGHQFSAFGETKNVADWTRDPRCEICYDVLWKRLKAGEPLETAIKKKRREPSTYRSNTTLTPDDVREIRRLRAEGNTPASLARKFGVAPSAIHQVVYRLTWTDLDPDYVPPEIPPRPTIDLQEIAHVYLTAKETPGLAVAKAFSISKQSAWDRVKRARKRGLI